MLIDHHRVCIAAKQILGHPVFAAAVHLPLAAGVPRLEGSAGQQKSVAPIVSAHPQVVTKEYLDTVYKPDEVRAAVAQNWDAVLSWARSYVERDSVEESAHQTTEPASPNGRTEPLDLPGTLDIEAAIAEAAGAERLELLRQRALDLCNERSINCATQVQLQALTDQRLQEIPQV